MKIDYSKGTALHRLYGHGVFVIEAQKQNRDESFIKSICQAVKCDGIGQPIDWRLTRL